MIELIISLLVIACSGHLASLATAKAKRDRPFGLLVCFLILCSPLFVENRPHELYIGIFAVLVLVTFIAALELRTAKTQPSFLPEKVLKFGSLVMPVFTVASLLWLAPRFTWLGTDGYTKRSLDLLARNPILFLIMLRGAIFGAKNFSMKNIYLVSTLFFILIVGLSGMVSDFAFSFAGLPLIAGSVALWADAIRLKSFLKKKLYPEA